MTTYDASSYLKTVTNLATYGDMESGWGNDTTHHKSGSKALKLTGTASNAEVTSTMPGTIALDPSHTYYFRMSVYTEDSALSGGAGVGMYWPIAEPGMDWKYKFKSTDLGKWVDVSWTAVRSSWSSGSYAMRVDFDNSKIAGSCWFDEVMIIDLTAIWGSGSEPTKAWCDANLPFVSGTVSLALLPSLSNGDIVNFPYSGSVVGINLPKGQFKLEVWGAEGGGRRLSGNTSSGLGGYGGYSKGTLTLATPRLAVIRAGGTGASSTNTIAEGGWNGGGCAWASSSSEPGNGGGGGSDIRLGSDSLYARVIVAGGGGGGGEDSGDKIGHGGGTSAVGTASYPGTATGSTGGGAFGQGAHTSYDGGGGGGGWYGGGTAGGSQTRPTSNSGSDTNGGGGGSGYVYTTSTASQYPSGCLLTSADYLADASTTAGNASFTSPTGSSETGHAGNGYVRITVIKASVQAIWVADGKTVRTDTVSAGAKLDPPDVSKTGYTYVWQVNGTTVDVATYDIQSDTTFTAVYTAAVYPVILWDSGTKTGMQSQYGHSIDLPTGSEGEGSFVGWWDGSSLHTTSYTVMGPTTLLARYDLVGTRISVDSVALQPNPVSAGGTILISVSASVSESSVPRWTDMAITTGDGMEFSSPYQVQIWDTSEEEDIATFENRGIRSSGMTTPPLSDPNYPSPRIGAWSAVIGDENGEISWTITGTGSAEYTSGIVVKSSSRCMIRKASIVYTSSNGTTTKTAMSETDTISFPSGTYKSFTITVQEVSEPYSHVRVLNVAPGGA
mgnify:FL=1